MITKDTTIRRGIKDMEMSKVRQPKNILQEAKRISYYEL